jgi:hypothetical protein
MVNEREELEALTQSSGWTVFQSYVESEWGAGGRRFLSAVKAASDNEDDKNAVAFLRQIIVAQREIQKLLLWPAERLKTLQSTELELAGERDYSRRGGL